MRIKTRLGTENSKRYVYLIPRKLSGMRENKANTYKSRARLTDKE